jgi:hypothetical protein
VRHDGKARDDLAFAATLVLLDLFPCPPELVGGDTSAPKKQITHGRQHSAAIAPFEQRNAQFLLELSDASRHGRLSDAERTGGRSEAPAFGNGNDIPDLMQLHLMPSIYRRDYFAIYLASPQSGKLHSSINLYGQSSCCYRILRSNRPRPRYRRGLLQAVS